jgi:excisionase family DNA binding protein
LSVTGFSLVRPVSSCYALPELAHDLDALQVPPLSAIKAQLHGQSFSVSVDGSSIDVMAQFGILEAHEVAELLKLRHSTVLDLSRRGILPAFKIDKHWRYRRSDLEEWMGRRRDAA